MKALTLYVVLGETELMRLFSASGALLCLCVFLCFYYTLFTPLLISPHPTLCVYTRRRRCARWRAARGSIQSWITFASSGLVSPVWSFIPACLDLLFLFNMLYGSKNTLFPFKVFLVKCSIFNVYFSLHHEIYFALHYWMFSATRGTAALWSLSVWGNTWAILGGLGMQVNYNFKNRVSLKQSLHFKCLNLSFIVSFT